MPLDRWIPSTRRAASRGAAGAAQQEQWRSSCTPIDPQASVQESMEKQMRTDREKRAQILQAEGQKQAAILTAEGEKQAAVLRAQGQREATILQADGQAKAIDTVFRAIHEGNPDPQLLAYQYVQALPQIAQGESNKVWIIPAEFQAALGRIGNQDNQDGYRRATNRHAAGESQQDHGGVQVRAAHHQTNRPTARCGGCPGRCGISWSGPGVVVPARTTGFSPGGRIMLVEAGRTLGTLGLAGVRDLGGLPRRRRVPAQDRRGPLRDFGPADSERTPDVTNCFIWSRTERTGALVTTRSNPSTRHTRSRTLKFASTPREHASF